MKTSNWIWAAVVVVIIGGIIWWVAMQPQTASGLNGTATTTDTTSGENGAAVSVGVGADTAAMSATVHYTSSGFSPASVTVAKGATVTFVDDTQNQMWVASNPHPVHTGYDGTSESTHCAAGYTGAAPFDECAPGSTFSFTFDKTGSWGYHNHFDEAAKGTIVVQ